MGLGNLWSEFKAFAFKGNMIDLAVAVVIGAAFSGVITSLVGDIIMPGVIYAVQTVKSVKDKAVDVAEHTVGVTTNPTTAPVATEPSSQPTTAPAVDAALAAMGGNPTSMPVKPSGLVLKHTMFNKEGQIIGYDYGPPEAPAAPPAAPKEPELKAVDFDWTIGPFKIGKFIGSLVNFTIVAAAVFVVIVKLLGSAMKKMSKAPKPEEPTVRECPECLSLVPLRAKRCSHCTSALPPVSASPAT